MIKASAGGGGRGMRLVHHAKDLLNNLQTARSEAKNAFGSDELILEHALIDPRHVEIQLFGDSHGHLIYLANATVPSSAAIRKSSKKPPAPS